MIVKEATLSNIESIAFIFDEYRQFYEKESDVPAAQKFLSERITNNESKIYFTLSDSNIITGFIQLYPIFSSTKMKRLWLLNDLYVKSEYRGNQISLKLINKAKELAVESKSCGLILETAKTNLIGNSLYIKTNFILDNEHNYYSWDNE